MRDGLAALALIWSAQQALILYASDLVCSVQAALIAATILTSAWPPVLCCALATRVHANISPWPHGWESHYWCATTDLTLLLVLVAHMANQGASLPGTARSAALADGSRIIRYQVGFYYLSAAFFKINTSFLDHRYSCASPYLAQLLAAYVPHATPADLAPFVKLAPGMVLTGELVLSIALLLAAANRGGIVAMPLGVGLALLLHFGIALTPPPNNIGAFSVIMACRLAFFVPPSALARAARLPARPSEYAGAAVMFVIAAIATSATRVATAEGGSGSMAASGAAGQMSIMFFAGIDWSVPTFVLMAAAVLRGVAHRLDATGTDTAAALRSPGFETIFPAMLLVAFVHAFVGPLMGLQDLGASNMYSNLRTLGGTNHLMAQMNLLRLSGGLVRIERCSSPTLNSLYPGEISTALSSRARDVLTLSGHSGRQFNWGMGRVLGAWALPRPPDGRFVRYTVPSLQLRRMLEETRAADEEFELEYTVLDGDFGDEVWRVESHGTRRVRVTHKGCVVLSEGLFGASCAWDELANTPLRWWERALGAWNPHPIIENMTQEMHCFGP